LSGKRCRLRRSTQHLLAVYSQESTDQMAVQRPVELAAVIGHGVQ